MNTTTTAYEFYCVLGSGEESILAVIEGRGETEADRLRDAESEAAEADIGRGHGPIMVRPAKKVVSDDEYAAARERVSAARATKNAVVEEIRLASIQTSILALYERARSLCGAGRAAWSRVDAARALRSTTWVNQTPEERAEDDALCAAFHAADKAEHDSISDLCAAIRAAAWGQQPDGSFVTRTSVTCGGWQMHHTLHAPCKQGPIVEVRDHERGPGSTLVAFRPLAEAREIRAVQRAAAKTAQAVYEADRQAAAAHLRRGGMLHYCAGQEYGFVEAPSGRRISARGALVAAGLTREEAIGWIETQGGSTLLELPKGV